MITVKKDEKRVITVLMDSQSRPSSVIPAKVGIYQKQILDRVENDKSDSSRLRSNNNSSYSSNGVRSNRLDIILAGENASVEVVGLVLGKGTDQKSLEAYITHAAPNTKSNVNVRSVLRDRSTFAFRGNVKIEKGAKGSDAYLRSDALLFDDAKMGDDTPALEILEPDVKAGHAATIGKVDEEMIFYLMSRGLSRDQSERMIIDGFVEPIRNVIARNESDEAI